MPRLSETKCCSFQAYAWLPENSHIAFTTITVLLDSSRKSWKDSEKS